MGAEIQDGAVLVARAILNSSLWTMRTEDRLVAITCICLANWKQRSWFNGKERMVIERGQFVRSWQHLADECHLSLKTIRTSVKNLENVGFLARKRAGHVQVFTIPKYSHYQDLTKYSDSMTVKAGKETGSDRADDGQATGSEVATNNNVIREEGKKETRREEIAAIAAPVRELTDSLISLWNVGKADKEWIRSTPKRIAKVSSRLKDGFTPDQIKLAVSNCLKSEWHQGANDRGWRCPGPEWVLHTVEKLEEWLNKTEKAPMSKVDLMKEMMGG
jgi:hypothetical protein